ncbi:MAG: hypothetical protein RTU92_03645 [Candidatus Thorarchaeota archaeon]
MTNHETIIETKCDCYCSTGDSECNKQSYSKELTEFLTKEYEAMGGSFIA